MSAVQVADGVWRIPTAPADFINSYLLEGDDGTLTLVDAGTRSAPKTILAALAQLGKAPGDVTHLLLSHAHNDHTGGARAVVDATGAQVQTHEREAVYVREGRMPQVDTSTRGGRLMSRLPGSVKGFAKVGVDGTFEDGDVLPLAGGISVVHTPGHTPGHLCFAEEQTRLFFSGDHVLPRISPNISTSAGGLTDPLRDYLDSLAAVRDLDPAEVLPAHEWRFRGLDARVDALTAHHEQRLTELLTAVGAHPHCTPWELAAFLTWSRPWSSYERRMRIFAVTETDAHLRLLASRGLVVPSDTPVRTWTAAAR